MVFARCAPSERSSQGLQSFGRHLLLGGCLPHWTLASPAAAHVHLAGQACLAPRHRMNAVSCATLRVSVCVYLKGTVSVAYDGEYTLTSQSLSLHVLSNQYSCARPTCPCQDISARPLCDTKVQNQSVRLCLGFRHNRRVQCIEEGTHGTQNDNIMHSTDLTPTARFCQPTEKAAPISDHGWRCNTQLPGLCVCRLNITYACVCLCALFAVCAPGTYGPNCGPCEPGSWCPGGSATPGKEAPIYACAANRYSSAGAKSVADCFCVPGGWFVGSADGSLHQPVHGHVQWYFTFCCMT